MRRVKGFIMSEMKEHRASERKKTLKKGSIVFNKRYSTVDCTVRNVSEHGAMLEVPNNHLIPLYVELNIYPDTRYCPAQVVWRSRESMGVQYIHPDQVVPRPTPQVKPLAGADIAANSAASATKVLPSWDGVERRLSGIEDRRE